MNPREFEEAANPVHSYHCIFLVLAMLDSDGKILAIS
jgi:hypothetical protein